MSPLLNFLFQAQTPLPQTELGYTVSKQYILCEHIKIFNSWKLKTKPEHSSL